MKNQKKETPIKRFYDNYGVYYLYAIVFIIMIVAYNYDKMQVRNSYLKDAFVSEGRIIQTTLDVDSPIAKYYVKINLVNPTVTNVIISDDDSYFEVTHEFYTKHKIGDVVGVLVGNYDVFKGKYYGWFSNQDQDFEKSIWGFENIFNTKKEADEAYPSKDFKDKALVKAKTITKDGETFFVLVYEEREITFQVTKEQYEKYNENDYVECDFQGIGDFIKIVGVHE